MVEVMNCKRCEEEFSNENGKNYKNCKSCREELYRQRQERPKYNTETHRICRKCKNVGELCRDFTIVIEKRSNICKTCRDQPKEKKEEKPLDINRVLTNVERNLGKVLEEDEIDMVMEKITEIINDGEEYSEVEVEED